MSRAAEPLHRRAGFAARGKHFPKITIGGLDGRAHTSRRGFCEQFGSKEACLVALLKEAAATGSPAVYRTAP
ncbi:hypothetical protein [Amycolatopsis rubida]|uniref:Uncharacterized protein n=1 Tax=Amycolatopsis rubida TaxID=112413 RepID=A0A1I5HUU0_9PSEU|nr:hypothetical protein [Amycolatopsis rubida]SFO51770.1 hypothetical protein SAMN05421854_10274 [Amycolatopsis rubida]